MRGQNSRWRSLAGRLLGFLLIPALSAVSPLIALPALTARGGATAWAAVAIGQSLGSAGATVVELGWGLTGPQRVARASSRAAARVAALSLVSKSVALVPISALCAVAASAIAQDHSSLAALVAAGTAANGMSLAWYFIGRGRPMLLLVTDSLPRLIAVLLASILLSRGYSLQVYPVVGLILPALAAPLVGVLMSGARPGDFFRFSVSRVLYTIRTQSVALSGRIASSIYIALPITIVGLASPQSVALFGGAERLQRMYLSALTALPNVLQNWVGREPAPRARLRRAERAVLMNVPLSFVCAVFFLLAAPRASSFVFSGAATVTYRLSAVCAVVIFLTCNSRVIGGILLVVVRSVGTLSASAAAGAALSLPAIYELSAILGPFGGLVGEAIAETTVLVVQIWGWITARSFAREQRPDLL